MKLFRSAATLLILMVMLGTVAVTQQQKPAGEPAAQQTAPQKEPEGAKGRRAATEAAEQKGVTQELTEASREAAGEGEENAQFKQSPSVRFLARITGLSLRGAYWLAIAINFLVIALAIAWFVKSNLPAMFRTRTKSIQKTVEEGRRASEDANRRLGEIESRLAKLDTEIGSMRAAAEQDAAAEEARIHAAAEEDKRKIIEAAENEIQAAARLAQRDLKAYAAELAISLAEKRVQVDPTTDRALVQTFTRELGNSNGAREDR